MHPADPRLLEALALQMPDAMIFADRDGIIQVWNQGAENVFGFSANEVVGQSLDVIVPERLRAAHWAAFHSAIDAGRTRHANQVRTTRSIHKDGRKLYVDLSFGLIVDAAGAVAGAVAVGRDCSERYLADKALRERLAAFEAAKPGS